ncbi:hypothetical protein [Micromonospora sp. DT4]|uniref:hypothetical protein n=1 Tax=Micromonospora sp. DT4 TaxID=3393438 RepID=UPI003CF58683
MEFLTTWVPSGRWLGVGGEVPAVVRDAVPVDGIHLVHVDGAVWGSEVVREVLHVEPVEVKARMVLAPVERGLGVAVVVGRGERLGVPVLVRAARGVGVARWGSRVVPFPGGDGAVVVLPVEHVAGGSAGAVIGEALWAASDVFKGVGAPQLWRAVQGLPRWDSQTADCVFRVGAVLTGLGVAPVASDDVPVRSAAGVAARLGGVFAPARLTDLAGLGVGYSTVAWVRRPDHPQHLVIIHRPSDEDWWLVETQANDDASRYIPFRPTDGSWGERLSGKASVLAGPILLPADESGQLLAVDGGQVRVGPPVTGSVLTDVLTDPARTSTPGMMAASTGPRSREMRVRDNIGALLDWYEQTPDMHRQFPGSYLDWPVPDTGKIVKIGAWVASIRDRGCDDPDGSIAAAMEKCGITALPIKRGRHIGPRITTLILEVPGLEQPHRHHEFLDAPTRTATIRSDPKSRLFRPREGGGRWRDLVRILKIWVAENPSHLGRMPSRDFVPTIAREPGYPLGQELHLLREHGVVARGEDLYDTLESLGFEPYCIGRPLGFGGIVRISPKLPSVTGQQRADAVNDSIAALLDWHEKNPDKRGSILAKSTKWPVPRTGEIVKIGVWVHSIGRYGYSDPGGVIAAAMEKCGITVAPAGDGEHIDTLMSSEEASRLAGPSVSSTSSGSGVGVAVVPPASVREQPSGSEGAGEVWDIRTARFGRLTDVDVETWAVPSDYTNESLREVYGWLDRVNPGRDVGGEHETNCVVAALCLDMSFRDGTVVYEAATTDPLYGGDLLNYQQQVLDLADGQHQVYEIPTIEAGVRALRAAVAGSRAFIAVRRPPGQVNHVLVGIRDERGVAVIDPQTGQLGRLPRDTTGLALIALSHEIPQPTVDQAAIATPVGEPVVYPSDGLAAAAEPDVLAHSNSEQRSGEVENAEATSAPSWSVRLRDGVTKHSHVYVIGKSHTPAWRTLVNQLTEAADADHPVVLLCAPHPSTPALESDIAALNYLLEQLAQRARLPVVLARATINSELLTVVERYGATILHPTLQRPDNTSIRLDPYWKATASRRGEHTLAPARLWQDITADAVRDAAALADPTAAVTRVDDTLGELIWAPDLAAARPVFAKASQRWSPQQMRDNLAHVKQMIKRVPDQPELSRYAPILEFGATDHADIVFDYALADTADRPATLLTAVGDLATAGKLDAGLEGGLTTKRLAAMVTAVGATDISASLLHVLGTIIKAEKFTDATRFIENNRNKLTVEQKQHWVDAIAKLGNLPVMENNVDELQELTRGVLKCVKTGL